MKNQLIVKRYQAKETPRIYMYQDPEEYRNVVKQIGYKAAAQQLFEDWMQREEHGLQTPHEAVENMIRIDLLSRGIY